MYEKLLCQTRIDKRDYRCFRTTREFIEEGKDGTTTLLRIEDDLKEYVFTTEDDYEDYPHDDDTS